MRVNFFQGKTMRISCYFFIFYFFSYSTNYLYPKRPMTVGHVGQGSIVFASFNSTYNRLPFSRIDAFLSAFDAPKRVIAKFFRLQNYGKIS